MKSFTIPLQVRWSDLDANFHVRHSVYYDWGAYCRVAFFAQYGLTIDTMKENSFGPILFREEAVFRKEIGLNDPLKISLEITRSKKDYSRWSIRHEIIKNENITAAVITVDGAWIQTEKRKLTSPPAIAVNVFSEIPLHENFQWADG